MSTKIYDGMMTKKTSLYDVNAMLLALKPAVKQVATEEYRKIFAKSLVEFAYSVRYGVNIASYDIVPSDWKRGEKDVMLFLTRALHEAAKKTADAKMLSDCWVELDFNLSVSLLPLPDKTLLLPFSQYSSLVQSLLSVDYISEYGYWDNTDPDENVSPEDWEKRKQDWDAVLPGIGIPAENGPTLRLLTYQDVVGLPKLSNILPLITEDMLTSTARWTAMQMLWKEHIANAKDDANTRDWLHFKRGNMERTNKKAKELLLSVADVCSILAMNPNDVIATGGNTDG